MPALWRILLLFAPVFALLAVRAEHARNTRQLYIFKPLATFCVLLIAVFTPPPFRPGYHIPVVLGLFFSLWGDVFLMLRRDRFLAGLFAFLIALVCYSFAFTRFTGMPRSLPVAAVLLLWGAWLLRRLWPKLGGLRVPVMVYSATLLFMAASAAQMLLTAQTPAAAIAVTGAVLFLVSDSLLAYGRFMTPDRPRKALVLLTYFAAQYLIALSI